MEKPINKLKTEHAQLVKQLRDSNDPDEKKLANIRADLRKQIDTMEKQIAKVEGNE